MTTHATKMSRIMTITGKKIACPFWTISHQLDMKILDLSRSFHNLTNWSKKFICYTQLYKIVNNIVTHNTLVKTSSSYPLQNYCTYCLNVPPARLQSYKVQIVLWKSLPTDIASSPDLELSKTDLIISNICIWSTFILLHVCDGFVY